MGLPPAQVLSIAATSADAQLLTGLYVLRGWSFGESTGSAVATLDLHDGIDATTPLVASVAVAQSGATTFQIAGNGILLRTGLFLDMTAGSVKGSIWYNAITHVDDVDIVEGDQGPYWFRPGT